MQISFSHLLPFPLTNPWKPKRSVSVSCHQWNCPATTTPSTHPSACSPCHFDVPRQMPDSKLALLRQTCKGVLLPMLCRRVHLLLQTPYPNPWIHSRLLHTKKAPRHNSVSSHIALPQNTMIEESLSPRILLPDRQNREVFLIWVPFHAYNRHVLFHHAG